MVVPSPLTPMSDRVTVGADRTSRTHRQAIDTRAPRPLRCVWIFNLLLRQRVRWDYPPVNSGPLAQGSVRYGLAHLDSVTVGFRGSHGAAVVAAGCSPPGATGSPGKFSGVSTRRIAFTVMLVMSVVAAALAGMLYAGRFESGRYQWGTGFGSWLSPRSSSSAPPASAWAA